MRIKFNFLSCLLLLHHVQVIADTHMNQKHIDVPAVNKSNEIPVIDLSSWIKTSNSSHHHSQRRQVALAVKQACEDIGFFVIQNHGVNKTALNRLWDAVGEFFDLPLSQKLEHQTDNEAEYPYGYEQSERLTLGKERDRKHDEKEIKSTNTDEGSHQNFLPPPDPKETFSMGPNNPLSGMPRRRYPNLPGMKEALDDGYRELEKLAMTLLRIFAVALELPEHWFADKMDRHLCALRALNYPSLESRDPLTIRAGAHTDYGALTILKSGGPGLQAKKDNNQGDWIDVPHIPDALIINLGDMMQRWTNDRWISTLHRVVLPPGIGTHERRQSLAFFVNVNGDAVVTPLTTCVDADHPAKHEPITAREHLMAKHLASMGKSNDASKRDEL